MVTHRQGRPSRPGSPFLNLEDETGMINVIVFSGCWAHNA
jgi:error-prone DNA polymerase